MPVNIVFGFNLIPRNVQIFQLRVYFRVSFDTVVKMCVNNTYYNVAILTVNLYPMSLNFFSFFLIPLNTRNEITSVYKKRKYSLLNQARYTIHSIFSVIQFNLCTIYKKKKD